MSSPEAFWIFALGNLSKILFSSSTRGNVEVGSLLDPHAARRSGLIEPLFFIFFVLDFTKVIMDKFRDFSIPPPL